MNSVVERAETGYDDVVLLVEACRHHPERRTCLTSFLDERSACYAGRGTDEVDRLRGYILGTFAVVGAPIEALPYIIEELETGIDAYVVAGAARALRGCAMTCTPNESADLLLSAIRRIKSNDQYVAFEQFRLSVCLDSSDTALTELVRTIAWLGPLAASAIGSLEEWIKDQNSSFSDAVRAEMANALRQLKTTTESGTVPCCSSMKDGCRQSEVVELFENVWNTEAEDQDGIQLKIGDLLLGRPFVLSFFYTRCMNPEKCSLTITKLAQLQSRLCRHQSSACTIAAFTYDPDFDVPFRLATYGRDRGLRFGERMRMLRTIGPIDPIVDSFDLAVGFGPVTVNRHRSEIMVFDELGRNTLACRRRAWDLDEVFTALDALIGR